MSFKFFVVPIRDDGSAERELNAFLSSHRVLDVDRRWVDQGVSSYWGFCIDYVSSGVAGPNVDRRGGKEKIDYKEKLNPADFALYLELRDLRKELSQRETVPVYTLFTNHQLAEVASQRPKAKAALSRIAGIGDARVEKYGDAVLQILSRAAERLADAPS